MAAHQQQNKISVDVAADSSSLDSFSFAGLLCVQDQQSMSLPTNKVNQIHKQGTEFEFGHATLESIATDPIKNCPADLLISNGKIVPQATLFQSAQHLATNQPCIKGSVQANRTRSKSSTDKNGGTGTQVSAKPNPEFRNQEKKEKPVPRSSFGQKIFKSFFFPCKQCQVANTNERAHKMSEENGKSH